MRRSTFEAFAEVAPVRALLMRFLHADAGGFLRSLRDLETALRGAVLGQVVGMQTIIRHARVGRELAMGGGKTALGLSSENGPAPVMAELTRVVSTAAGYASSAATRSAAVAHAEPESSGNRTPRCVKSRWCCQTGSVSCDGPCSKHCRSMSYVHDTLESLKRSSPAQTEFYQAAEEVLENIEPLLEANPHYIAHGLIQRIVEPERQYLFRVTWTDDAGVVRVNKGYRVQFNSALGPYKGGLRFHPSVTSGVIKFLGFEQIFKNALTGLSIGGGKGGADFDPKLKSDKEVMRFCQAYMTQLHRHIGPLVDVPAGDIGVGLREIGYLYGQYRLLTGRFDGAMTGKGQGWGGSLGRKEATGYGCVYFTQSMLAARNRSIRDTTCLVSGAGNVAIHTIEKLLALGARPITCSDSSGAIHDPQGIDLDALRQIKERDRAPLARYLDGRPHATFMPVSDNPRDGHAVWRIPADVAFPCATQNELTQADAEILLANGVHCVSEGANMPCTADAVDQFLAAGIAFGPGKAANAGGVAVSQLEMQQNAGLTRWTMEQVEIHLKTIMADIFTRVSSTAAEFGAPGNLVLGANIAGFRRVADAMIEQGIT